MGPGTPLLAYPESPYTMTATVSPSPRVVLRNLAAAHSARVELLRSPDRLRWMPEGADNRRPGRWWAIARRDTGMLLWVGLESDFKSAVRAVEAWPC